MDTSASDAPIIIAAVAAAFTSIMVLFFKYMTNREKQSKIEREDGAKVARDERKAAADQFEKMITLLGDNLQKNTESNKEIAASTTKQAFEAEKRNGHLAELQLQSQEMFEQLATKNYVAINELKTQTIENQIVNKQTVNHEHVEKLSIKDKDVV